MSNNYHNLRYCPVCGKDTYTLGGEKLFTCSSCGFDYYHNTAGACALIIEFENKVLFTVRKFDPYKGSLDLPGGFVDYYESVEEGLSREVKEELNLTVDSFKYMGSFPNEYVHKGVKYHTIDMIFTTKLNALENIKPGDDVQDYKLYNIESLDMNLIKLSSIRTAVEYYKSHKDK